MNIFSYFKDIIKIKVEDNFDLPDAGILNRITVESPRDASHGDLATNAALLLAKPLDQPPRAIAEKLSNVLNAEEDIAKIDIAGPGFINLTIADAFWQRQITAILTVGKAYGDSSMGGQEAVNVEYVSANPTGPLHIGHVRGAIYGDALANLLTKAGFDVTKEYYINDAGVQIDTLANDVLAVTYLEKAPERVRCQVNVAASQGLTALFG